MPVPAATRFSRRGNQGLRRNDRRPGATPADRRPPGDGQGAALRYELVDGERRLRAVKLLGWKTIRAEIGDYTDAQVRAIVLATALQRKDLNAIEEARAMKAALDAGDAAGPTELAQQLGLSQGQVSNRLRLLELPADVQVKIISREIPPSHARAGALREDSGGPEGGPAAGMGRAAGRGPIPAAMAAPDRIRLGELHAASGGQGSLRDERPLGRSPRVPRGAGAPAALGIVRIAGDNGSIREVATNLKAWTKLQLAHEKPIFEKKARSKAEGGVRRAEGKDRKPTAGQQKRLAAHQAQVKAEQARRLVAASGTSPSTGGG